MSSSAYISTSNTSRSSFVSDIKKTLKMFVKSNANRDRGRTFTEVQLLQPALDDSDGDGVDLHLGVSGGLALSVSIQCVIQNCVEDHAPQTDGA